MKIENGDTSLVLNIVGGFYFNLDINEKLSHIKTMMLTFENAILIRDYLDKYLKEWHKTTGINKQTKSEGEKMQPFIDYTVEQFTDDLGHSPKGAGFSIPSDCTANLFNNLRKMLNFVDSLLSENEKYKKGNKGLKEKHSTLFNDREVEKDNYTLMYNKLSRDYEKLKSENEVLSFKTDVVNSSNADLLATIEKLQSENEVAKEWNKVLIRALGKIPGVITTETGKDTLHHDVLESFVKNALAKELEREKWYVVKCSEFDKPMPAYINSDGQWICDGYCFDDNDINVLNTTPIDLGEKV